MNKDTKIKTLLVSTILLAVLNIAIIGTIIYNGYKYKKSEEKIIINSTSAPICGDYFRKELNFSDEQMQVYHKSCSIFRSSANKLIRDLNDNKDSLHYELEKENPNMDKVSRISDSIGHKHSKLKVATAKFYLGIKKCCTPSQQKSLNLAFKPLFNQDENVAKPGKNHSKLRNKNTNHTN